MKWKLPIVLFFSFAACAGGCQDIGKKTPTQKEVAVKQWNQSRADVLGSLAKSQLQAGNLDQARQTIGEAIGMAPEIAAFRVTAGKICIEQGKLDEADKQLATARKLDPKNAEAEYLGGVVYQRWQKNNEAYDCYLRASMKDPNELAYVLARAEMLVTMNCAPEALTLLKTKLDSFDHSAVLHHTVGQLLVDQSRYPEAIKELQRASLLASDDQTIREHLAMAYFQNHQYREAGEIFARLIKLEENSKRSELWVALGECQMQTNHLSDARNSFDTATQLNPTSTTAWLSLAKATLQLGDTRRSEIVLRKVITLDANSAEGHLLLGYVRVRQSKLPEALVEFRKASALDQKDPVSLCMIGYVLEKTGKPEQAMKYYADALKLKPNDELAAKLMASIGD